MLKDLLALCSFAFHLGLAFVTFIFAEAGVESLFGEGTHLSIVTTGVLLGGIFGVFTHSFQKSIDES